MSFFRLKYRYIFHLYFLLLCCGFMFGCENDENQIRDLTKNVIDTEIAKSVESYLSNNGEMRAKLTAPIMYRVLTDTLYVEFPRSLHVDFYDDSLHIESWLDSKYGKYFENYDKVYLRDSVVVINIKGDTLKCPDLWWDQNQKLFYTDKYAEYHAKGKNIFGGKGLEATQDLSSVTFKDPTGVVEVSDNGIIE